MLGTNANCILFNPRHWFSPRRPNDKERKQGKKNYASRLRQTANPLQTLYELFPFRFQLLHSHALTHSSPVIPFTLESPLPFPASLSLTNHAPQLLESPPGQEYLLTSESFNWELNGHQRVLFSLEKLQFLVKA